MKNNKLLYLVVVIMLISIFFAGRAKDVSASAPSKPIELRISHFMPTTHIQHTDMIVPFAEELEKRSGGRVKVTIFSGGALGKPTEHYDMALTGRTDIAFTIHVYTPGRFPLTSVMLLPMMSGPTAEATSKVLWELYNKFPEIQKEHEEVKVLRLHCHGPGMLHTAKKQVKVADDLKGLKIRGHGDVQVELIKALGAIPQTMDVTEVYTSMERGVVDGTFMPASGIKDWKLAEVARHLTKADLYVSSFLFIMNKNTWNSLPKDIQKIIDDLGGAEGSAKAGIAWDKADKIGLDMAKAAGREIYELPKAELAKWKARMDPIYKKWIADMQAKGLPGEKVFKEASSLIEKSYK